MDERDLTCSNNCCQCGEHKNGELCSQRISCTKTYPRKSQYLLIKLQHFSFMNDVKINTVVTSAHEFKLENTIYELICTVDHLGSTIQSGHWITKRKTHGENWVRLSDENICPISKDKVISKDNYIMLYQKKIIENIQHESIEENIDVFSRMKIQKRKDLQKSKENNKTDDLLDKNKEYNITAEDMNMDIDMDKDMDIDMDIDIDIEDLSNNNSIIERLPSLPKKSKENTPSLLSSTCRGCSKVFTVILTHLKGKKAEQCKKKYTDDEIEDHKKAKKQKIKENIKIDIVSNEDDSNNKKETVLNTENLTNEDDLNILSSICRGCSKDMPKLVIHLNSKKGQKCRQQYGDEEIENHKQAILRRKNKKYYQQKRELILSSKKAYDEKNREDKKAYYEKNREDKISYRKVHYEENREPTLYSKKVHYEENRESILSSKTACDEKNKEHRKA